MGRRAIAIMAARIRGMSSGWTSWNPQKIPKAEKKTRIRPARIRGPKCCCCAAMTFVSWLDYNRHRLLLSTRIFWFVLTLLTIVTLVANRKLDTGAGGPDL